VGEWLSAYLEKRLGEYYALVASSEKEYKSLEDLQAEFAPSSADLITEYLFTSTRFRVDSTSVEGDSALVFITSRSPSLEWVIEQASTVEGSLGPDVDMSMKLGIMGERFKVAGTPVDERETVYRLVREPSGWRVIVGWADMSRSMDAQ
jgi:hypothetical protein